jgi:hypothetical protein
LTKRLLGDEPDQISVLHSTNSVDIRPYLGREFTSLLSRVERYWFRDPLLKKIRDQLGLSTLV